jgi:hypothetical protein
VRELPIKVKTKKGEDAEALLMIPDTVQEMVGIMGQKYVLETMTNAYIAREKRRLISGWKPREKILKIKESSLSPEQRQALVSAGLIASK